MHLIGLDTVIDFKFTLCWRNQVIIAGKSPNVLNPNMSKIIELFLLHDCFLYFFGIITELCFNTHPDFYSHFLCSKP